MCGIVGAIAFNNGSVNIEAIISGMECLAHRGPDGDGLLLWGNQPTPRVFAPSSVPRVVHVDAQVALGHRRLAVVDLEGGFQPLSNEDRQIWVTFNGEIYNHIELRGELRQAGHEFKTASDTEVIIHAYEEWGVDCVKHFNGIFSFVIWDNSRKQLYLARDHIGVKPLYYTQQGDFFIFASEIKALLRYPGVEAKPNYNSIATYWLHGQVGGCETFFKDIYKLLPANWMTIDRTGVINSHRYWQLPDTVKPCSLEEATEGLDELLHDAVRLQLRSDVPVGAHLSGGIDSSLVVALASNLAHTPLQTFTGCWVPGAAGDERGYARLVAEKTGSIYRETSIVDQQGSYADTLALMIWHMDEPTAGPGLIPQYWVSRLASQHLKVVLGGQGGDEMFGGYRSFLPLLIRHQLNDLRQSPEINSAVTLAQSVMSLASWLQPSLVLRAVKRRMYSDRLQWLRPAFASPLVGYNHPEPGSHLSILDRFMRQTLTEYLVSLLQVEDRTSMAVSLESRVPLLDYRMVEFAVQLPYDVKIRNRMTKLVMRQIAGKMLPPEILARKDKVGFTPPENFWFSKSMAILVSNAFDSPYINDLLESRALKIAKDAYARRDQSFLLYIWRLVCLDLWFKTFIK